MGGRTGLNATVYGKATERPVEESPESVSVEPQRPTSTFAASASSNPSGAALITSMTPTATSTVFNVVHRVLHISGTVPDDSGCEQLSPGPPG